MNTKNLIFICLVFASSPSLYERVGSAYESLSSNVQSKMECVDSCYRKMRDSAKEKFSCIFGGFHNTVKERISKAPQSIEEFKQAIAKITRKGRKKAEKEQEKKEKKEL